MLRLDWYSHLEYCFQFNYDTFNLTTQTPIVLGSMPPSNYTVTYHVTLAAANAGGKFNNLTQQMINFIFVELWKKYTNDYPIRNGL